MMPAHEAKRTFDSALSFTSEALMNVARLGAIGAGAMTLTVLDTIPVTLQLEEEGDCALDRYLVEEAAEGSMSHAA